MIFNVFLTIMSSTLPTILIAVALTVSGCVAPTSPQTVRSKRLAEAQEILSALPPLADLQSDAAAERRIRNQRSPSHYEVEAVGRATVTRGNLRRLMQTIDMGHNILDYPGLISLGHVKFVREGRSRHYRLKVRTGVPDITEGHSMSEFNVDFTLQGKILRVSPVEYPL